MIRNTSQEANVDKTMIDVVMMAVLFFTLIRRFSHQSLSSTLSTYIHAPSLFLFFGIFPSKLHIMIIASAYIFDSCVLYEDLEVTTNMQRFEFLLQLL